MPFTALATSKPIGREWAKHLAIWLCITALFPLTTWYATAAFHPPPDELEFRRAIARYSNREDWPTDQPAKDKFFAEKDRIEKEYEQAQKVFYRRMFWVTYPLGLLAILVGLTIPMQAIGAGLMFGGIFALTAGCYSAWDVIGRWTHFWSLIIALACIVGAGFWHFQRGIVAEVGRRHAEIATAAHVGERRA